RIVAFHYFASHYKELNKWVAIIDKLAQEYNGKIEFVTKDIESINTFHNSLDSADFGSYRADIPPRLYGVDNDGFIYTMHMLFSYKYIKDFCEKLLQCKMFEAIVLNPTKELDLPPQNYYHLVDQSSKDLFVMFYDPSCYYWTFQLAKLRKLCNILMNEDVSIVIVNRGHNYLGIDFDKWSELCSFHGATRFETKQAVSWTTNLYSAYDSSRDCLRYIAQHRNPELKEYDKKGESRYPEMALDGLRYLY
ncbi:hypothetical protein KR044_004029, partial [Drosophila immigrans]